MAVKATIKEQAEILKNGAKYQAVKLHVKKHKMKYAVGSTIVVTYLVTRQFGVRTVTIAPVFNNTANPTFNNTVNLGGHMTKMVKRMSDGKMWETVTSAAAEAGSSVDLMSKHLNGHKPDVYGEVYKIVGVGTTG